MQANRSSRQGAPSPRATTRRTAHRFVAASLVAVGWVGLSSAAASAALPDPSPSPSVTLPEVTLPTLPPPTYLPPTIPSTVPPTYTIPPFTIPEVTVPPLVPGETTTTTTWPDGTTTTVPGGSTSTTVPGGSTTTTAGEEVQGTTTVKPYTTSKSYDGEELAYTGNDSAVPLAGAGLVAAGGLVAGLSVLARRLGARAQG